MGWSKAAIAIRGNHTDELSQIVDILNYLEDDDLWSEISKTLQVENGWTVLFDEEMTIVTEDDLLLEVAETLETEVLGLLVQSTSATYGFSYFNASEHQQRIFLVQDAEIIEDTGDKLAIEQKLTLDQDVGAEQILAIAESFQVVIEH